MPLSIFTVSPELSEMGVKDMVLILKSFDERTEHLSLEIAVYMVKPTSERMSRDIVELVKASVHGRSDAISMLLISWTRCDQVLCDVDCGLYFIEGDE